MSAKLYVRIRSLGESPSCNTESLHLYLYHERRSRFIDGSSKASTEVEQKAGELLVRVYNLLFQATYLSLPC